MSRGLRPFRQRDLTRALRGARAAGYELARIEIGMDGRIIIIPGKISGANGDALNPWDEALNDAAEQQRSS